MGITANINHRYIRDGAGPDQSVIRKGKSKTQEDSEKKGSLPQEVDKRPTQEDTYAEGLTKERGLEIQRDEDLAVFSLGNYIAKSKDVTNCHLCHTNF